MVVDVLLSEVMIGNIVGNLLLFISLWTSRRSELALGKESDVDIRAVNAAGLVDRSPLVYLMHNA
jgi:hypothetical protein